MDTTEARMILGAELIGYRAQTYEALQRLLETQDTHAVQGPSGVQYQIEVQAVWDDRPGGNLRVLGHIDDGGLRAFVPVTDDFIMTPTGLVAG